MFRQFRDRLGSLYDDQSLRPDFDLGPTSYVFQSERGTDYTYVPSDDGQPTVGFASPSGAAIWLLATWEGVPHASRWQFFVTVDGEPLGRDVLRAADVPKPLRQLMSNAISDLNAESRARRQRHGEVIERAAQTASAMASEPTPADRLRSDFDLGSADMAFTSARGWEYEYMAPTSKASAGAEFMAPSGSDVFLVFEPGTADGRREVRIVAFIDDVEVNEAPLLTVRQFPESIQWLMGDAIADLNLESEARAARRRETLDWAGRRPDDLTG